MAANTAKDLRDKTSQELVEQMRLVKKQLFDGVVKGASGEAIKAHEKRQGKRLIARIQTLLRERTRRDELNAKIAKLEPAAKDVSPKVSRQLKKLEARTAEVLESLAKPAGQRKCKSLPGRVRARHLCGCESAADGAAVKLAEARRARAALERPDVGHGR